MKVTEDDEITRYLAEIILRGHQITIAEALLNRGG